jgi:phosphomannomutase
VEAYPCSGEINSTIENPAAVIEKIKQHYASDALDIDLTDGLSMSFDNWRFNVRMSNTEPVVRLNVESKKDVALMKQKTNELLALMK